MTLQKLVVVMAVGAACAASLITSCSKSNEKAETTQKESKALEVARVADRALEEEKVAAAAMIEKSGFQALAYEPFPAQEIGKKGRVQLYASKDGKGGGIIYYKKTAENLMPAWHWYFDDMVPESVEKVELNGDGLWDLRVLSNKGKSVEFVQDETFTLVGKERSDWIALNGESSPPLTDDTPMWKAFDGDSATSWTSSMATAGNAYIDLKMPFGFGEGILTVRATDRGQPKHISLYANDKKFQEFDLEQTTSTQTLKLDVQAAGTPSVIRLMIDSSYGDGDEVSISELVLQ